MAGRSTWALAIVLVVALLSALPAVATAELVVIPVIDGSFTDDWGTDKAHAVDMGGADDVQNPGLTDVTEASAFATDAGMYLLMAWDDSGFTGGNSSTAGVTLHASTGWNFRIYGTASGATGTVDHALIKVYSCDDSTCASQTLICQGAGCAGMLSGASATFDDPFAGRASPHCGGTDCGMKDTAVEIFLPWTLFGGPPGPGSSTFFDFGSYPSGSGQAPKDDVGPQGVTCVVQPDGSYNCFRSTPSQIRVAGTAVSAARTEWAPAALIAGAFVLGGLVIVRRRRA